MVSPGMRGPWPPRHAWYLPEARDALPREGRRPALLFHDPNVRKTTGSPWFARILARVVCPHQIRMSGAARASGGRCCGRTILHFAEDYCQPARRDGSITSGIGQSPLALPQATRRVGAGSAIDPNRTKRYFSPITAGGAAKLAWAARYVAGSPSGSRPSQATPPCQGVKVFKTRTTVSLRVQLTGRGQERVRDDKKPPVAEQGARRVTRW